MRKKRQESRGTTDKRALATTGEIFANGKVIEPLRDVTVQERLRLLFWSGLKSTLSSEVEYGGRVYKPATINPTVLQALMLPTKMASSGSAHKLLSDISKVMMEFTGFPENTVAAASHWVLGTWFPELRPAVGLSLLGPETVAGVQLFKLLHSFAGTLCS
jgi:hypothetical protein